MGGERSSHSLSRRDPPSSAWLSVRSGGGSVFVLSTWSLPSPLPPAFAHATLLPGSTLGLPL